MNRHLTWIIALGVLAALAIWMITGWSGQPPRAPEPDFGPGVDAAQEPIAATAQPATVREELASEGTPLAEVLVVDAETQAPVPAARVTFVDPSAIDTGVLSAEERSDLRWLRRDQEGYQLRYGETVVADASGRARVPLRPGRITGRKGNLYGETSLSLQREPEGGVWKLELERDYTLRVQVLDHLGQPAVHVPILLQPIDLDASRRFSTAAANRWCRTEAPDGIAVLAHVQDRYRGLRLLADPPDEYRVNFDAPGWTGPGVVVDPWNPPAEPPVLQLPPTGTVVVETADLEGQPLPLSLGIRMTEDVEGSPRWSPSLTLDDATFRYDWVVAGKTYRAEAALPNLELSSVFAGPRMHGETVRETLSPDPRSVVLEGRAVDREGVPLTDASLSGSFEFSTMSGGLTVRTDQRGRFRLYIGHAEHRMTVRQVQFRVSDSDLIGQLGEMGPFPAGRTDLGDVVFQPPTPVVAGRILLDGVPYGGRSSFWIERAMPDTFPGWEAVPDLTRTIPGDGTFEFQGQVPAGEYRLAFRRGEDHLARDPIPFTSGQSDVLVELASGGVLELKVRADVALHAGVLENELVPLTPVDEGTRQSLRQENPTAADGVLEQRWTAVPPGPYRVEVRAPCEADPLAIETVRIARGNPVRVSFDLQIHTFEIRVTDMDGQALPNSGRGAPTLFARRPEPGSVPASYRISYGAAHVVSRSPALDILVGGRGYRTQELLRVQGDVHVTLDALPEVDVGFAGGLPALPRDATIRVRVITSPGLQEEVERNPWVLGNSSTRRLFLPSFSLAFESLDERGRVQLPLPDGVHQVRFELRLRGGGQEWLVGVSPFEIHVDHGSGRTRFDLALPPDTIGKTVEAIEAKR